MCTFLIFETEPCFISQVDFELKLLMHWLSKYQSYGYVSPHWPLPGYFKSSLDYFYCRIQQKFYINGFMLCCLGNNDPPPSKSLNMFTTNTAPHVKYFCYSVDQICRSGRHSWIQRPAVMLDETGHASEVSPSSSWTPSCSLTCLFVLLEEWGSSSFGVLLPSIQKSLPMCFMSPIPFCIPSFVLLLELFVPFLEHMFRVDTQ